MARASASICCSPPESVPAGWFSSIRQARKPFECAALDVSPPRTAVGHDPEILPYRQVREHTTALGNQAETPAGQRRRRSHAHLFTGETDLALARTHDAGRQREKSRLSGPVCPEDSGYGALLRMSRRSRGSPRLPRSRPALLGIPRGVQASVAATDAVPRYAAWTFGSARTSAGVPVAMTRP